MPQCVSPLSRQRSRGEREDAARAAGSSSTRVPAPAAQPPTHLVRQHGAGDDVTNSEDARHSGLEVLVHLDAAALVQGNAHPLQAQALSEGPAACRQWKRRWWIGVGGEGAWMGA